MEGQEVPPGSVPEPRQLSLPLAGAAARGAPAARLRLAREAPARRLRLVPSRPLEEERLEEAVLAYLPPGKAISLTLTDNRYSMVAVRRYPDRYKVRVHRMFADIEARLVRALARYVVHNDRKASLLLGDYIERNKHIIRQQPRRPRQVRLRTAGRHHDLQAIFDRLNARYFDGRLEASITWGPKLPRRRRRSIKMGSFAVEDRIIRIHPALDQADVPAYFVAWIVFHEMLHGKHGVVRDENGRRCFHPQAFLDEERTFEDYERACVWERRHIDLLLGG